MQTIKETVVRVKCDRCNNIWTPKVEQPVKCPRCGHRFDSARIYQTKKLRKVREAQHLKSTGNPNPNRPKEDS